MKWTIWHTTVVTLLGLAFVAVTVIKHGPGSSQQATADAMSFDSSRAHTRTFWQTYERATRHRTAGRMDSAAVAYRAALRLRPTHHDALYYLGHIQYTQRNLRAADSTWQRLVEVNPESARGYTQLGEVHFCFPETPLFDLAAARTAYRHALDLHNEETRPLLRLGTIALIQEQSGARQHLEAVRGSNANNPAADLLTGYLDWRNGQSAQATVLLRKAQRKLDPNRAAGSASCPLAERLLTPLRTLSRDDPAAVTYARLDSLLHSIPSE